MLRRTPIFQALDPAILSSGLLPDVQAAKLPLWVKGQGVEFVAGKVKHRRGNDKLLQVATQPVRGVTQQRLSNGEIALWWVQNNILYRWDQFALQSMAEYPVGPASFPYVDFTQYGDWLFINRGYGSVTWWNGDTFATLPQMPNNIAQLRKHLSFLMAFGVGSKKTGVGWSDANDISVWVPSKTHTAGTLYIDEFEGGIVTAEQLGPVIAVYSENQMALVSFIGSPFWFGQKVMQKGIGAVGIEAVTADGNLNYGVSRQGIWVTDGQDGKYIDTGKLHDYLQENVNWSMAHKILAVKNDIRRTVDFFFPMAESLELNEGWAFDPTTQGWSQIPPISFFDEALALGLPVQATTDGELQLVMGQEFAVTELLLQTRPLLMQLQGPLGLTDAHFDVKVDEVELFFHKVRNCQMRIGSSREFNGQIHWSSYIPLDAGKSTYKVPANVPDGVYWHIEFTSTTSAEIVVEEAEEIVEDGEAVIAVSEATSWQFDLQGFLLFGAIEGSK